MRFGRKIALAVLISSTVLVAGCATETTYRPATGQGFYRTGYTDRQIEPNRFLISFAGNSVTSRDTVERYLFFRAAELTLQQGYDYFLMADRNTDRQSQLQSTPDYGGFGYGGFGGFWGPSWRYWGRGFGYGFYDPFYGPLGYGGFGGPGFDLRQIDRYEASAEIVMRKGAIPGNNLRAFDARKVVQTIGPTVVLPK